MQKDIDHRVFIVHLRKPVRSFLLSMLNSIMVLILLGVSSLLKVMLEMVVLVVGSLLKSVIIEVFLVPKDEDGFEGSWDSFNIVDVFHDGTSFNYHLHTTILI